MECDLLGCLVHSVPAIYTYIIFKTVEFITTALFYRYYFISQIILIINNNNNKLIN